MRPDPLPPSAVSHPPSARAARCRLGGLLLAAACLLVLTGCRQQMADQPPHKPLDPSDFFRDGASARPLVPGTVARGQLRLDEGFHTGMVGKQPVQALPFPLTRDVLQRGRERFEIFCSPCHGRTGAGDGMVVQRGFRAPTSYHIDRLRQAPLGYFVDVITHGFGSMPDYATQVPPRDRWAIAAYIRALQLSQGATLADVPPAERKRLQDAR